MKISFDSWLVRLIVCLIASSLGLSTCLAQAPVGSIEGSVTDASGRIVSAAQITVIDKATGATRESRVEANGQFRFVALPVADYTIRIEAPSCAKFSEDAIHLSVGNTVLIRAVLSAGAVHDTVTVDAVTESLDLVSNNLGKTVTHQQIVTLPLNGRNFAQLGLLQTGVAPLTAGLITQGGSLRSGQSYAVNGQRPEANNFLLDGAQNVDRMDGGFALRVPIDAIQEFRILTATSSPEYGGNIGSVTSVVTRGGTVKYHGSVYEFFRNDIFDTRNYFSKNVEPLKQNQFGGTVGGPVFSERFFFFSYYEGLRNRAGVTTSAVVPTTAQQNGDFSGNATPLINYAAGGVPVPGGKLPPSSINSVGRNVANLYPTGNVTPSVYTSTVVGTNNYYQTGIRLDLHRTPSDS